MKANKYGCWDITKKEHENPNKILTERSQNTETPVGTARAEDPLCKAVFFAKLAEAVPTESGVF